MKHFILISTLLLGILGGLRGQDAVPLSMVGLSKEEVKELMKTEHREFHKDASVIKQTFNYLKYVNGIRTKTWIIYFTDKDICRTSKLICDYSDMDEVLEEIRAKFGPGKDDRWEYVSGKDTIVVELLRQEWYFTIRETKK